MLGGLIERTDTKNINGIPGLAQLPLLRYLFSDNSVSVAESEVLIVMTPHVIRFPSISAENLRTLAAGTDSNARVYSRRRVRRRLLRTGAGAASPLPSSSQATPQPGAAAAAQLHFDPSDVTLQVGERKTLSLAVSNVDDLYSIPLLIHYDPAVVQVEEVLDGGFLSGGKQEIAIVQRIDPQKGRDHRFSHSPAEYAGRERIGHAARADCPWGSSGQDCTSSASGERAQLPAADHSHGLRRSDDHTCRKEERRWRTFIAGTRKPGIVAAPQRSHTCEPKPE